jgi:putative hydrolase of the HAD superfamily
LALRAVILDYGMVLSGPQNPEARAALLRLTGLSSERFDRLYWTDRSAYDEGLLTGKMYWQNFVRDAGLSLSEAETEELNNWDVRMWMSVNAEMVAWQLKLNERGLLTGIISNMGDSVLEAMQREFEWLARFDVLVWSYQLGMVKPDPAIYRYALEKLGTRPEEALFIDDKRENVGAATAMGIKGIVFSNVEQLRADLIANHLDRQLPLP